MPSLRRCKPRLQDTPTSSLSEFSWVPRGDQVLRLGGRTALVDRDELAWRGMAEDAEAMSGKPLNEVASTTAVAGQVPVPGFEEDAPGPRQGPRRAAKDERLIALDVDLQQGDRVRRNRKLVQPPRGDLDSAAAIPDH